MAFTAIYAYLGSVWFVDGSFGSLPLGKTSHNNTHIDPHFNLFYLLRVSLWRIRDLCEKNTNESHKYPHNMAGAGPFPFSLHPFSNYFLQIDVGHRVSNVSNRRIRSWRPGPGPKDIRQSNQRQVREPTFQLN